DPSAVKEELGDLFLHLVFYSKIGEEEGKFNVADVLHAVCDKLVHRHPHIYGDVVANTEEEVLKNWEKLKLKEGKKSVLEGVPSGMPAINKAIRLQEKTAKIGFEWDRIEEVWLKVEEEQAELQAAIQSKEQEHVEEEFGDLLFALLNYSRFLKIDAEAALEKTNQKFKKRFEFIEERAKSLGKNLEDMSLAEMDAIWNEAKKA
ncbi:MAG: nucleoside triphosphate pyrophosphohydrolase, partial [Bacteroidetes bacterium]|nr:nucleoside triphosphate pyrophosphohydrolase [Bacteroidota bacterium]